jgi:hypothetical protein
MSRRNVPRGAQADLFAPIRLPRARVDRPLRGELLRDAGKATVTGNTDPAWRERVLGSCRLFLVLNDSGHVFTGEDLRAFALAHGSGEPHHPNAWSATIGSVIRSWRSSGRCVTGGVTTASAEQAHARLIRSYRLGSI